MKRVTTTMVMAAMAVSIHLSGCGRVTPGPIQAPPATSQVATTPSFFVLDAAASSNAQVLSGQSTHAQIMSQLNLDDAQKTELKLIRSKVRALFNREEMKAKWQNMQALLNAQIVDADALKAFIASIDADHKARVDAMVALAGEMRDVLTDEQRDKLVSLVSGEQTGAMAAQALSTFRTNTINALNLSTSQQETLTALQARMEAQHDVKREAKRKAFIQFIVDGNQLALADSLKRSIGHDDVDTSIQWLGSLSQDQRKILVDRLAEIKKAHMALMTEE
ncbi:MAG TPA: Spy/CpxP family protein refolding chaperone [Pantanalinema sp.]